MGLSTSEKCDCRQVAFWAEGGHAASGWSSLHAGSVGGQSALELLETAPSFKDPLNWMGWLHPRVFAIWLNPFHLTRVLTWTVPNKFYLSIGLPIWAHSKSYIKCWQTTSMGVDIDHCDSILSYSNLPYSLSSVSRNHMHSITSWLGITLGKGALYSQGRSWRFWQLEVVCWHHSP